MFGPSVSCIALRPALVVIFALMFSSASFAGESTTQYFNSFEEAWAACLTNERNVPCSDNEQGYNYRCGASGWGIQASPGVLYGFAQENTWTAWTPNKICYSLDVTNHFYLWPVSACPEGTTFVGPNAGDCQPITVPDKNNGSCGGGPDAASSQYGNPCNAATGNKLQIETDDNTSDVAIIRHYNSQFAQDIGLGFGWTSSLSTKRLRISGNTVQILRADARGEVFTCTTGNCVGDPDTRLTLVIDASGYLLSIHASGATERYDVSGKLRSETNSSGRVTTFEYDDAGRVNKVTGPFGHTLTLVYGTGNHITSVTNSSAQVTGYRYDTNANLVQVDYPDGTAKLYHYENTTFPHHLTGISWREANGSINRYANYDYDSTGKAFLTEHTGGIQKFTLRYDSDTQTTVTDAINIQEVMTFETTLGVKNLISKASAIDSKSLAQVFDSKNNLTCKKDEEARVTTYTYNSTNQKLTETRGLTGSCSSPQLTSATRTTTYRYLAPTLSLPTVVESPSVLGGSVKRTEISYQGNLPKTITQRGFTPNGLAVSRTVTLNYNGTGQVTAIDGARTDVNDVTTLAYYECTTGGACGQLRSITNALGHVTVFDQYDANGRLLKSTDPNGLVTSYQYDLRGRVRFITETPPVGTQRVTEYRYNAAGDVVFTAFPDGRTLAYTVDAARLLRRVTDNLGNYITYGYDAKGNRTQEYTYDVNNVIARQIDVGFDLRNRVSSINDAGALTQQVHDAIGNLIREVDPKNNPAATHGYDALNRLVQTVNSLGGTSTFGYDVNDRVTTIRAPHAASTQYSLDDLGNLLQETSPDRGSTVYTYDAAGNLSAMTDARGITAQFAYDALNRVTRIDYPDTADDVSYRYDTGSLCSAGVGRLCEVTDPSGTTQRGYDAFGNLLIQTKTELGRTYTTRYTYNAGNRAASITYPDNRITSYTRDALGRISSIETTVNGATQTIISGRHYHADGLLMTQAFGNGLVETRQYNLKGELRHQSLGATERRLYEYDLNGNVILAQSQAQDMTFSYDALDRLTAETGASDAQSFTYDANGNRLTDLTATGHPRAYTYAPGSNRLIRLGGQTIETDQAGYTLADRNGNRVFTWDAAGRLRSVTRQGVERGVYTYNHLHQRTQKVRVGLNGKTARFVYHYDRDGRLLAETRPNGNLVRRYIWADNELIAQIQHKPASSTETLVYVHVDHLGTPRLASDGTQSVVWRGETDAFGTGKPDIDPDENEQNTNVRITLSRGYRDGESNLIYVWNRYLDKNAGRWITSDPIGLRGGLNTYAYVANNPLRFVDPLGLEVSGNIGAGGFGNIGPFAGSVESGASMDSGGTICLYVTVCSGYGWNTIVGGTGGIAGGIQSGRLCPGNTSSYAGYWYGGAGLGGEGTASYSPGSGGSGGGSGGGYGRGIFGPSAGGGAGGMKCTTNNYMCFNVSPECNTCNINDSAK